ncbi:RNA polymerase sigma factor [Streptomyces sp. NPDC001568]|uniref:RNA polymerase sigma factor n=1 Tax=Streptomyces sp. NPDC001568 TaxID=3364588 RepID=UPI00369033DA
MLDLAPTIGPLTPGFARAWRGLWWWLSRRDRTAPPAGPGTRPYAYTYDHARTYDHAGTFGDDGTRGADEPPPKPTISELYHAHRLGMVRLAVLLVDDPATAEDVVQDAFTALYRRYGEQITEVDNALGYLRTSVVNTSRSVLRRRRTARAWVPPVTADMPSAEASVVLGEAHREVLAALRELSPRRRQVLVLRYWADLSEAEIAATLGISRGSVKSNASRGLDALERILEGRV